MAQDFTGKVAVVTGGASGIGEATCRLLASSGAWIAVVDRNEDRGLKVAKSLRAHGATAEFWNADVGSSSAVEQCVAGVVSEFGGIDVLAGCAGVQRYGTVVTTPEETWDEVMGVNLKGAYLMSKAVIPIMIERGSGSIVLVGSVQSLGAVANSAAYVTSKHALVGLTRSMALDFAKQGIRANCVCPGAIDTPMLRAAANQSPDPDAVLAMCAKYHLFNRLGQPEEVARLIVFLASDEASFLTGGVWPADGGGTVPVGGTFFQEGGTTGGK